MRKGFSMGRRAYAAALLPVLTLGLLSMLPLPALRAQMVAVPQISDISPRSVVPGSGDFVLTVRGAHIQPGVTRVAWNGEELAGATCTAAAAPDIASCAVTVPAAKVAVPDTAAITLVNPGGVAGSLASPPVHLTVTVGMAPWENRPGLQIVTPHDTAPLTMITADVNGDGHQDVVVNNANATLTVVLGDGTGRLTASQALDGPPHGNFQLALAALDFDEDGIVDIVGSCSGIHLFSGNGDGTFRPAVNSPAEGCGPAATGDFNGDGHVDIAVTDEVLNVDRQHILRLYLGNGAGQFTLGDTLIRRPMAVTQSLVAGDFDSDGALDLLRASGGDGGADAGTLSLITFDSTGLMTERWSIPTAPQPILTVGDFNNDGHLDAVVSSGIVRQGMLYLGDGSGTFTPAPPFPIDLSGVGRAWATDFDGDGLLDVVLTGCLTSSCEYYDFLRGDGTGGFVSDRLNPSHETAATLADMNNDGRIDLVGKAPGQNAVSVVPQYGQLNDIPSLLWGSVRYQTPATRTVTVTAAGFAPVRIHSITLTDGYTLGSGSTCSTERPVVPGIPCTIDVVFTPTHAGPHDGAMTVVADVDMVEASFVSTLSARSDTFGYIGTPVVEFGTHWVGTSTPFTNSLVNAGDAAITISGIATSGPFTVDGSACPVLLLPGMACPIELRFVPTTSGAFEGYLQVTGNDRSFPAVLRGLALSGAAGLSPTSLTFAPRGIHTDGAAQTVTVTNTDPYPLNNLAVGLGGPDPQEFAIVGGTCLGTSTLAPSASCTIDVAFRALSVGAKTATLIVDGSGTDQAAALSGTGLGSGIPYIQQLRPASLPRGGGDTVLTVSGANFAAGAALLFNGAPLPTLVNGGELRATVPAASLAAATTAAIAVRNPVPGGEVSNTAWLPITTAATPAFTRTDLMLPVTPENMATGDFNADGIVDVAVADCHDGWGFPPYECSPGAVTIMLGTGAGPYSTATRIPLPYEASAYGLVAGDFNSDGRLDLLVTHGGDYEQHLSTLIGDGAGGFTAMTLGPANACAAGRVTTADVTRVGNLDLFLGDFSCFGVMGFTGNGLGGFGAASPFAYFWDASGYNAPTLADFDGDGLLDVARSFRGVRIVKGTGSAAFGVTDDAAIPDATVAANAVGDLNGDGRPDLVTIAVDGPNNSTGALFILMNDGSGFHGDGTSAFAVSQRVPLTGRDIWWIDRFSLIAPVLADLNGDGALDIVVMDGANVRLLLNDGTGQVTQSGEPIAIGNSPRDLAVVDVNGDGRLDIVISNGGDRAVTMLMQASPIATPTVAFGGAPATALYRATFTVTATTNANVMPTITAAGACRVSGVSGTPTSSRATVTMTSGEGSCALEAAWPDTADYAAASATQATGALKVPTLTVLMPGILNPSTPGQPVLFAFGVVGLALPLPSGTVTVTASTGESCTGAVSILPIGACTITLDTPGARTLRATYSGDQFFESSTSAAVSQTVAGPVLRLTPASFNFRSVKSGSTKKKVFTLANTSAVAARITSVAIGAPGTGASSYRVSSSCGATLAANRSCDITVTFAPTSTGAKTATLIVTDDATGSPHTASLTGSGK